MHAVREAEELQALNGRRGLVAWLLVGLCCGLVPGTLAREAEPGPSGGTSEAKETPPDAPPAEKGKAPPAEAPAPPPKRVKLPDAGVYRARDILPFAAVLTGRTVRMEETEVGEREVTIPRTLGLTEVTLQELVQVLHGARLYLFPHEDPEEGPVLVVSTNPHWTWAPRHHTRVIEADPGNFPRLAEALEALAEERNARLPKQAEPMVAVAAARVGKILVSSPRKEDVEAAEALVERYVERRTTRDRMRMYQYQGRHRTVVDLQEALYEELSDGEARAVQTVVATRGNRLLLRCPESLGDKVLGVLKRLDRKEPSPEEGPRP